MNDATGLHSENLPAVMITQGRECMYRLHRNGSVSCIVLMLPLTNDGFIQYQQRQLLYNKIRGFLQVRIKDYEDSRQYYYDITSTIPLKRLLSIKRLTENELLSVICQIADVFSRCDSYLLDGSCLVLDSDFIYADPACLTIKMMYLPIKTTGNKGYAEADRFKELVIEILHSQVTELTNNLCSDIQNAIESDAFSIPGFAARLKKMLTNRACSIGEVKANNLACAQDNSQLYAQKTIKREALPKTAALPKAAACGKQKKKKPSKDQLRGNPPEKNLSINPNAACMSDDRTVLLSESMRNGVYLQCIASNEVRELKFDCEKALIGRKKDHVNFIIENNAVGKIHAKIIKSACNNSKDSNFSVLDLESKNGTYLNNVRITPGVEAKIKNRDIITFANSEYIFLC